MSEFIDNDTGEAVRLGLVPDMTNDEYHAALGFSSSQVRAFSEQSPLHYWWKIEGKDAAAAESEDEDVEDDESKDLKFGTAVHAIVLEPHLFHETYRKSLPFNARKKAGRAYRDEFAAKCLSDGKIAIHPDEHAACLAIAKRVREHPVASGFLTGGKAEQSYFVLDKELGVVRKCRPDYLLDSGFAMTDLKTCRSASPRTFYYDGKAKGYHLAVPWYLDILDELYGEPPKHFVWVAVEKKPPYAIGIFFAKPEQIAVDRETVRGHFAKLVQCHKTGHWPDWGESEVLPFEPPRWTPV